MGPSTAIFLLVCLGCASAAVWIEYQKLLSGKTPFCEDKTDGSRKKVGDIWQDPKECIQKRCMTDSQGTPLLHYSGCGVVAAGEGCRIVESSGNLPYPECCKKVVCD